jgi:hypothetical protein
MCSGRLNDLWKFDGEGWVWVSGSKNKDQKGVYGQKGIPNSNNIPGGRSSPVSWIDNSGNLWIFGGAGYDSSGNYGNAIQIKFK